MKKKIIEISTPLSTTHINLKIKKENGVLKIFDPQRKKYILLTPEEYVRQSFVEWLKYEKHYPESLISNEVTLNLNNTIKRCDTIIFDNSAAPLVLIEYKAPFIQITQETFNQILRYNLKINARLLLISNGILHFAIKYDKNSKDYHFLNYIPDYIELINE